MESKEEKSVWTKLIIIVSILLTSTPLVISVFTLGSKPLTFIDYEPSVWIGFWGSYLGGIIGTVGVIYVAHIQNKKHQEENKKMMEMQRQLNERQISAQIEALRKSEDLNKSRLKTEMKINMLEKHVIKLKNAQDDLVQVKLNLIELVGFSDLLHILEKKYANDLYSGPVFEKYKSRTLTNLHVIKNEFTKYSPNYFPTMIEDLAYNNIVLNEGHPEVIAIVHEVDNIVKSINSKIKDLDIKFLEENYTDDEGNFVAIDKTLEWVRDEKAKAYESIKELIESLDRPTEAK